MTTGEAIQIAYQLHATGYELGFNGLLQVLGIVLSGVISFIIALFVLRRQRNHDMRKEKIEKCLQLLKLTSECIRLLMKYASTDNYKNPFSNLSNNNLLDKLLEILDEIRILYYFTQEKNSNLEQEVSRIYQVFIYSSVVGTFEELEPELIEIGDKIEKRVRIIENEVRDYIKD